VPDAGYLAWVDLSAYGWGDDPATRILAEARVAVHHGPQFGPQGAGHVRELRLRAEVLTEAIARIGRLVDA
jgi:cystathionine beta-lyase